MSKEATIETMVAELVEMFQAALEAGLNHFVDDSGNVCHRENDGGYNGDGRSKKSPENTTCDDNPGKLSCSTGEGAGREEIRGIPGWVSVTYDTLVPELQGLLNHITRVHLRAASDTVAANSSFADVKETKADGQEGETTDKGARSADDKKLVETGPRNADQRSTHKRFRRMRGDGSTDLEGKNDPQPGGTDSTRGEQQGRVQAKSDNSPDSRLRSQRRISTTAACKQASGLVSSTTRRRPGNKVAEMGHDTLMAINEDFSANETRLSLRQ